MQNDLISYHPPHRDRLFEECTDNVPLSVQVYLQESTPFPLATLTAPISRISKQRMMTGECSYRSFTLTLTLSFSKAGSYDGWMYPRTHRGIVQHRPSHMSYRNSLRPHSYFRRP